MTRAPLFFLLAGAMIPAMGGGIAMLRAAESANAPIVQAIDLQILRLEVGREIDSLRRDLYLTSTGAGCAACGLGIVVDRRKRKGATSAG